MNVRGSAAQGPTTATRRRTGRPSPSRGSAVPGSSRTTDRSAISRARARLPGESRSASLGCRHRALRCPVRVEQPERRLLGEQPPRCAVHDGLGQFAAPHLLRQPRAEADGVGQLDVDAGGERERPRLVEVRRDPVHRCEEGHGPVVGDDRPGRIPTRRAAGRSATRSPRPLARRPRRSRSSSPSRPRRARWPSRTEAGSRPSAPGVPSGRDRGCGRRGRRSTRRSASKWRVRRRSAARGRTRRRASRPGTGPRPSFPRPGPSGSPARRPAPARAPGGHRGGHVAADCGRHSLD